MKTAIFLVTSLAGVKKLTFKQKIKALMNDHIQITIVLAIIKLDDNEMAKKLIQSLFHSGRLEQLNIISLASLMLDSEGIAVADNELFNDDFSSLPSHRFEPATALESTTIRYVKDGEIIAEVEQDGNDEPLLKTRFENHLPIQAVVYENGHQFGILNYQDGELSQSLLLNDDGQLVFRFIRHTKPVNFAYTMGRTSKLKFTELLSQEDEEQHIIYQASEKRPYYEVVDYANYDRFDSVYSFYAQLLQNVVSGDEELFIDLNDNPQLTPYLPQQLIFNY